MAETSEQDKAPDRLEAFTQAEVERTRGLERAVLVSFFCNFFFVGARQRTHWV